LTQEIERNWSLVGTGYFVAIVNIEQNALDRDGEMGFVLSSTRVLITKCIEQGPRMTAK
jgi:hypothetical protein